MKLKHIIYAGLALTTVTACNDFLEVDSPSAYTAEFVFSQKTEISRALNGVYAQALAGDLYGNAYQRTFILNSDVDMQINSNNAHAHNAYARFDCDDQGNEIYKFWTAAYNLIEYANKFITAAESSELYNTTDSELMQWIGEARCLRAMAYHDLVVMFGDVPFTFEPAASKGTDFVIPVADRETIQNNLIDDLKKAAPYMSSSTSTTVERCSKEFAQGLIARIALTAGGYSLRPDSSNPQSYGKMERPADYQKYYQIVKEYTDAIISSRTHSLSLAYPDVFVNECNYLVVNNDDPIFEIPFAKESTGNTGYLQGPTYSAYEGKTVGAWGACSGTARLNAFYRFLFRDGDVRREFVNGLWYYSYYTLSDGSLADSVYIRNDYTVHNNKWSKLWTPESSALGSDKEGSTGINYPYMRYADILLMYAEAANELGNGPDQQAITCLETVHRRAFPTVADGDAAFISAATGSKEAFQKAVLDERKWEFAGENMRWRDLVRTNTYSVELLYSFLRYYSAGIQNAGSPSGYEDAINQHDGYEGEGYIDNLPERIYFHQYKIEEANAYGLKMYRAHLYGYAVDDAMNIVQQYPNQSLKSLRIYNAYKPASGQPVTSAIKRGGFSAESWNYADFYQWGDNDAGTAKDQCKYSFYGFARCDDGGNLWLVQNGTLTNFPSILPNSANELPVVRYLLPYPNLAIQRSAGAYKNAYGY